MRDHRFSTQPANECADRKDSVMNRHGTCGNCTWEIDNSGQLIISSPEEGNGRLAEWNKSMLDKSKQFEWLNFANSIKEVSFDGLIHAPADCSYMFCGCDELKIADMSNLDIKKTAYMRWIFQDCPKLECVIGDEKLAVIGGFSRDLLSQAASLKEHEEAANAVGTLRLNEVVTEARQAIEESDVGRAKQIDDLSI